MKNLLKGFIGSLLCCAAVLCPAADGKQWYEEIFKEKLTNASGWEISTSALKGKMVGVYFSASWCGPCRGFTPKLVSFYNQVAKEKNLEIVFVSWDRTEDAMMQYMKKDSMPWLAVPFNNPSGKALKNKLRIRGIPTFVIYDSNGKLVSNNGRWDVVMLGTKAVEAWQSPDYKPRTYQDYRNSISQNSTASASSSRSSGSTRRTVSDGKAWYEEIFKGKLTNAFGREISTSALKGKMVGVYFSASWCGPCRGFTPKLVSFYNQVAKEKNLEIVFVSWDRTEDAMMQYMKKDSMPWLAVPFHDPSRQALGRKLGIHSIPTLVIYDSNGKLVSNNGRWDVVMLGTKAVEAWQSPDYKPRTYQDYQTAGENISSWLPGPTKQWHIRMDTALKAAQQEHKKIFILSTGSDWCGWCKKLYKDVLSSPEFIKLAEEKMILVYLDTPNRKPMPELQKLYNREVVRNMCRGGGYPSVTIVNEQGQRIGNIGGYRTLEKYMASLREILNTDTVAPGAKIPPEWVRQTLDSSVLNRLKRERQEAAARAKKAADTIKNKISIEVVAWGLRKNAVNRPFDSRQEIRVPVNTKVYFKIKYRFSSPVKVFLWMTMRGCSSRRVIQGKEEMIFELVSKTPHTVKKMSIWLKQMPESRAVNIAAPLCFVTFEKSDDAQVAAF